MHHLDPGSSGLSRRQLIRGGAALGLVPALGGLLAACGDDSGGDSGPTPLNAILWPGLFDQSLPWFEKENNIKVKLTPQVDPIQTANMIKAQPGTFDVASFGPFDSPMVHEKLAIALDKERIKDAWDVQYPYFQKLWDPAVFAPESFGGKVYHVPYQWGSNVLAWNTKRIKTAPKSWTALGDPAYKGKTSFNDQAAETYGVLALAAGGDPNDFSEAALNGTNEVAARWFDNAKMIWSTGDDVKQLLAQEEVWIAHIWDGTARQLLKEGYPIDYAYPEEGVRAAVDGPGIMTGAEHVDAAYEFLNFSMSTKFGVEMGETTLYASGNRLVAEKLSAKTREIMRIDEMGQLLESGKFKFQSPRAEDFAALDKWWSALKLKHQS